MMTSWNVYALIFPSGRKYIGVAKNPTQRFARHYRDSKNGSDLVVHKAIRKYGIENVNLNILFTELTAKQAKRKEIQTIIECGTQVPKGYNMTAGGDGVVSPCLATKQKMSKSHKGQLPWNTGKIMSEESRLINSKSHKGQQPWMLGKKHTEATKQKMRGARKRKLSNNIGVCNG